jgi:hypothetical protein
MYLIGLVLAGTEIERNNNAESGVSGFAFGRVGRIGEM